MKGSLKSKSAFSQFLIVLGLALVSLLVIGMIGSFILSSATGISLTDMADPAKMDFSKPGMIGLLRGLQLVQFISLFIIPVFTCAWLFSDQPGKYLGLKKPYTPDYFFAGVGILLIAIPFTSWLGEINRNIPFPDSIASWMKEKEENAARSIEAMLRSGSVKDLLLNLLFIAGLAAVGEELLFRGLIQRLLIKIFKSPWAGILVAAALFSAMHMQFYGFLPRLALGILLGAIYWYSGSLWAAILAHFVYDASLIVLAYNYPEMLKEENNLEMKNLAVAGSISLALVVLIIMWMRKRTKASFQAAYADDVTKNHPFDFEGNTPE